MSLSKEEKYAKLMDALDQWGALKGAPTYEEAVQQLEKYVRPIRSDKNFQCSFGKFALCADGWSVLTQEELELGRKLITGKQFVPKKPKLWVRAFADVNYHGKEMAAIATPGLVLWEVANVDETDAQTLCDRLSELLSMPVVCKGK